MVREKEEILYFKTEKERMAYLRNKVVIEPIEYVEPPKEAEKETVEKVVQTEAEEEPKKKRGKKKNVAKEVQTD